jgi:hypothetical protein
MKSALPQGWRSPSDHKPFPYRQKRCALKSIQISPRNDFFQARLPLARTFHEDAHNMRYKPHE